MIYKLFLKKIFFSGIFFLALNLSFAYSSNEINIVVKVENEIITNVDIEKEYRYLLALNNNLKDIPKNKVIEIAKKSIIKEKIKEIEILKVFKEIEENAYFNQILNDFYRGLNLKDENELKKYLSNYRLKIKDLKNKLLIETYWNELIFTLYRNQIQIDEEKLRKRLKKKLSKQNKQKSYLLYEILFNGKNKQDLLEKYDLIKKSIEEVGFKNTANIYSASNTAINNGKIGWINENQLSDLIKKDIDKINVGEYTELISVPNGSLLIKLEDIKEIEKKINFEQELKNLVSFERNRQLNQFSAIYFNKIKANLSIDEK